MIDFIWINAIRGYSAESDGMGNRDRGSIPRGRGRGGRGGGGAPGGGRFIERYSAERSGPPPQRGTGGGGGGGGGGGRGGPRGRSERGDRSERGGERGGDRGDRADRDGGESRPEGYGYGSNGRGPK